MSEMPAIVVPMLPTLAKLPFSDPNFLFEPKWDGYRAICFLQDGVVRFTSKSRKTLTERFPELQSVSQSIKATTVVLDGEIVALDKSGIPCFDGLRSRKRADCVVVYYAFDLLHLDGQDLMLMPLLLRKAQLKKLLPKRATSRIRYTDHVIGSGEPLFEGIEKLGLEGMVAKRIDSLYVGGRTRAWLKIKTEAGREEMRKRSEAWQA
jgi:bifunctional non-homologous end joining protein LigD